MSFDFHKLRSHLYNYSQSENLSSIIVEKLNKHSNPGPVLSELNIFHEDDLITERTTRHYTLNEWKSTWMNRLGEQNALFISATQKENFEEFRERVYEAVRQIHITRFPYNKFLYPDYKDAIEKEE
mgnify:FL=1